VEEALTADERKLTQMGNGKSICRVEAQKAQKWEDQAQMGT
jgi:hypothetical protein